MSLMKINTHGDDNVSVYYTGKLPTFYHVFKTLYPTVYTLWQHPEILPAFRTWRPVFDKLQKGADLMLPGVIPDKAPSPKMFGNLKNGELVSIKIEGNKAPVALGCALLSGEDMYMSGLKGKGVGVLHIVGDSLWECGDKSSPPDIPDTLPFMDVESESSDAAGVAGGEAAVAGCSSGGGDVVASGGGVDVVVSGEDGGPGDLSGLSIQQKLDAIDRMLMLQIRGEKASNLADGGSDEEEEEEKRDPVFEMDKLLDFCFACAIKSRVKKSDLPLLTGQFQRDYMQPFSGGKQLDLKKSSYKKLSKFLKSKVDEGYIVIKEQSKGVDVIVEIDKTHLGLRGVQVPELSNEGSEAEGAAGGAEQESYTPLTFSDVYSVNANTADFFKELGYSKTDVLLLSEVRECVVEYVRLNNLQREDKKTVTLDPVLAHTILKPSEGDLDRMVWEQVINRVVGKMSACVAISGSGAPIVKKGKMDAIKLSTATRASNKKVTLVENLEDYGIDIKVFSRLVQRAMACSCSITPSEQKGKGSILTIQGNQITFVGKTLLEKYKIPKRFVTGLENAPKQKKK